MNLKQRAIINLHWETQAFVYVVVDNSVVRFVGNLNI